MIQRVLAQAVGFVLWLGVLGAGQPGARADGGDLRTDAQQVLKRAATFYREHVARHGGYVYYTSLDLRRRWGEGKADEDTIFVQPPGTPTVGTAFLRAFDATGDRAYLDAARDAAEALVHGQLESGGWTQTIHFGPARRKGKYRHGAGGDWNASSLDDAQTQSALQMLARTDRALRFRHAAIHEATLYGLNALLAAQFPNGAFPQVWTGPVQPAPVVSARYPDYDWRVEGKVKNYWDCYTLNDGVAGTVADTLILAHQTYGDASYRDALGNLANFLILAQMPGRQPAWCQQYSLAMVPIWARKFEPPAVSTWESQDVLDTLIKISRYTGNPKYLAPVPRALAYLKSCVLPDGRLARYHELSSNRPLYMDSAYRLTYDDAHAPAHYGWKQPSRLDAIERAYEAAKRHAEPEASGATKPSDDEVRRVVRALDAQGRWVSTYSGEGLTGQPKFADGFPFLSSEVFCRNVGTLCAYLAPERSPGRGEQRKAR